MSGGSLGSAAASAIRRPTIGSVTASTFLLAGSQALGILLEPTGVKRGTFNDFAVNPGDASDTVPYIAGTVETIPHLITYFDFHSKKVKNDTQISQMLINAGLSGLAGYIAGGGTFGFAPDPPTAFLGLAEGTVFGAIVAGLGQLRTASYRYYCGFLYGICHGPIDSIAAVKVDERLVSNGAPAGTTFLIDDPQAWGGDHVDGGVYAVCDIIPGNFWPTQLPNTYLQTQIVNAPSYSGKAMFLYGGFTRAEESGYFAATPQGSPALRPLKLRVVRLPDNLGVTAFHNLSGDANIAECCFEWLTSPVFGVKKLPLSKIDVASFQAGAEAHFNQGVGISVELNSDVDVETALDKFTDLGGSIIYGGFRSGTIKYKIIERNYSIPSLPVFRRGPDGSAAEAYNVVRREGFTPGTWSNTANDFAFDYLDKNNNYLKTTRYVQDTANRMLTGRIRSLSQTLDGVSNGTTAAFVGTRELRAGAYPRPPLTLAVNRDGYQLEPGDVIKYIDNVDNFTKILRISEVQKIATDDTAEIVLNCVEDQYGVGASAYSPFIPAGFHLTLHLHLALEDNFYAADENSLVLLGLADSVAISNAVFTSLNLSDTLQALTDAISLSSGLPSLNLSDSIALTDAFLLNNAPPSIAFINSFTAGTLRSNASFFLGFQFTVGASDMVVTDLGRWRVSGNAASHTVKITEALVGPVLITSASIDMSSGTVDAFKYTPITPVTLLAGHSYYCAAQELNGGDQWSDDNATVATEVDATITNSVYEPGVDIWQNNASGVKSYVAPNFKYYTLPNRQLQLSDSVNNLADAFAKSVGPFLPSDLADIWEWWEPSRNGFTNGQDIDNMAGQFAPGTGHDFTQASAVRRPDFIDNVINGLGVVRAPSTVETLQNVDPSALTAGHVFIVIKTVAETSNRSPWAFGTSASQDHYAFTDNSVYCGIGSTTRRTIGDPTPLLAAWRVVEVVTTSSEWTYRLDGATSGTGEFFTTGTNTVGFKSSCVISGFADTNGWGNGDIAGVYIFSAKLSSGDRTLMVGYLNNRFALSIS